MTASLFRTIGFPDRLLLAQSATFDLEARQTSAETVYTPFVRAAGPVHMLWGCEVTLAPMSRELWQEWQSFRARIAGQIVLFTLRVPGQQLPLGAGAGYSPTNDPLTITGTTITGTTVVEGGTTAIVAQSAARDSRWMHIDFGSAMAGRQVLKHGDKFGHAGNLYQCVGNVTADANGEARVPFRWRLWKGAKAGDIITLRWPTCRVQLRGVGEGKLNIDAANIGRAGFSAIEVPFVS